MSTRDAMRRLIPPGSYVLFLFFLAGILLTISPFAMTTQPSGSHWIASTVNKRAEMMRVLSTRRGSRDAVESRRF